MKLSFASTAAVLLVSQSGWAAAIAVDSGTGTSGATHDYLTHPCPYANSSSTSARTHTHAGRAVAASTWTYRGCVTDGGKRLLSTRSYNGGANSPDYCVNLCSSQNYRYAGVQYGVECWCGNSLDNGQGAKVDESKCNVACPGDKGKKCGAAYITNLYERPATGNVGGGATPGASLSPVSSNAAASAQKQGANPPAASGTKFVWAHHMVGNTYSYKQANWLNDIQQAKNAGMDGFALNMGRDPWQPQSVAWAYAAAQQAGGFKLFFSFDMTSFSCGNDNDANILGDLVKKYANHPAQARYNNRVLVTTFAGENCNFGRGNQQAGWQAVKNRAGVNYFFMPATFMSAGAVESGNWYDGQMNWDAAWPNSGQDTNTARDTEWLNALGNRAYMAPVSPFFFTYYGANSWNKNWIYRSDNWLLISRFEQLIAMRGKIDMLQLLSWNDYGESHYIGGVGADQPNSQGWTSGMPHNGLQSLVRYYATAFKTGTYPNPTDRVWLWSRPHPKGATATAPTNPRPSHWEWTDDKLYVAVMLGSAAQVKIESGRNQATWNLDKGMTRLSLNSAVGAVKLTVTRGGKVVKSYSSEGRFTYTDKPRDYNFNYFVAEV